MPYLFGTDTKTTILKSESHKLFEEFEVGTLKTALTVSTALIAANSTVVTINGDALAAVVFATDAATTMAALATAIAAHEDVSKAEVSGTTIYIYPVDKDTALTVSATTTLGSTQPTWTATNDTNTIYKGQPVQLQSDGTIEPVVNGDYAYKNIGIAMHDGTGGELVTVMMKGFAIVFMESATDSLVAGPVTVHSGGYNTTSGYMQVDDASVDQENQLGWALDPGDDGDVIRVVIAA